LEENSITKKNKQFVNNSPTHKKMYIFFKSIIMHVHQQVIFSSKVLLYSKEEEELFVINLVYNFYRFNFIYLYTYILEEQSWSWLYGSWIYNYLCNQCLSPLKLCSNLTHGKCMRYNIMWSSLSVTCDRSVVFFGYSDFLHQ
jgi:hypothetical protein